MKKENKQLLLRWCLWFSFGNAIILYSICWKFILAMPQIHENGSLSLHLQNAITLFKVAIYIGHLSVLAFSPCLVFVPLIFILPYRHFILPGFILVASSIALFLCTDSFVFSLFHLHLSAASFRVIFDGFDKGFFDLSFYENAFIFFGLLFIICIESAYGFLLWKIGIKSGHLTVFKKSIFLVLGLSVFIAYFGIFIAGDTFLGHAFMSIARGLPFYSRWYDIILAKDKRSSILELLPEKDLYQPENGAVSLRYPLQPLQYPTYSKKMNIVFIVIDTWRFDMMNAQVTPNINQFSKQSLVFNSHISGGNSTGPGIFSLFYAMPAFYWSAMTLQKKSPVFLNELQKNNYQMGIFSSNTLRYPVFNQNVFSGIKNLRTDTPGKTPADRDRMITKEFQKFVPEMVRKQQPFFSFIFYDSAHSYCYIEDSLNPFHPVMKNCERTTLRNNSDPLPYLNRYKNSLFLVDNEIKEILQTLVKYSLMNNTIVIITGDHGEEFNDNHLGYWGHASNFTHYQVQTPLIVYWPGKEAKHFHHQTSHYDIVPTLMTSLFGVTTKPENYSFGKNLFDERSNPFMIVNSYLDLAVIENQSITTIHPSGEIEVSEKNGDAQYSRPLNKRLLQNIFKSLGRFYQA